MLLVSELFVPCLCFKHQCCCSVTDFIQEALILPVVRDSVLSSFWWKASEAKATSKTVSL